jgi:predicted helicase
MGIKPSFNESAERLAGDYAARMGRIMDSDRAGREELSEALRAVSCRPLGAEDIRDYLVHYMLMEDIMDGLFGHYPYLERNECRRMTKDFLSGLTGFDGHKAVFGKQHGKFLAGCGARPDGADRQELICDSVQEIFRAAYPKKTGKYGVAFTPVQVVDFMVHGAAKATEREHGVRFSDGAITCIDPFAGTGIFAARVIQLGYFDGNIFNKYKYSLICNEYDIFFWHIMSINIEEVFWRHTGGRYGFQPFVGARLTDTFQEYEDMAANIRHGADRANPGPIGDRQEVFS